MANMQLGVAPDVASEDFTQPGVLLQDSAQFKDPVVDSENSGYGTELDSIDETMASQRFIDEGVIKERFWDTFIVDALIGNWDRHNGNWGILYDEASGEVELAPVFDCGSSLFPQADDEIMTKTLKQEDELNLRVYEIPTSRTQLSTPWVRWLLLRPEAAVCRILCITPFCTHSCARWRTIRRRTTSRTC